MEYPIQIKHFDAVINMLSWATPSIADVKDQFTEEQKEAGLTMADVYHKMLEIHPEETKALAILKRQAGEE